jgi:ATP-dependent Lon protease
MNDSDNNPKFHKYLTRLTRSKNTKAKLKKNTKAKLKKNTEAKFTRTINPIDKFSFSNLLTKKVYTPQTLKPKKKSHTIKSKRVVHTTEPKRKMHLKKSVRRKLNKKKEEQSSIKTKKIKLDSSNILSTLMGELLINSLVNESNKHLDKNIKKKKNDNVFNDSDYNSEEDSDYIPESEFEDFPSDVEYTLEEENYIKKLNKSEKDQLMLKEFILNESKKKEIPIRFKILNMDNLSLQNKNNIIDKLNNLNTLDSTDNEYHKLSTWVSWLEKIPFGENKDLQVTNKSSPIKIGNFLKNAKKSLDSAVFGHIEAKEKIITILTKQISNPNGEGSCIAIQGPPGNGKTTLVKEGICKALGRPFAFIALGGMQDSSFMMGHEYTYEGSKPGRIIEILSECGCMNPVIYFDELDKISQSPKGEEIANFLCHLTDPSQNSEFHDKYMSGIDFDLSKAIFIFSYNNVENINPILLDRLFKIKTDGFDVKSKVTIAKNYLVPRLLKEYNIIENNIIFSDKTLNTLIDHYTHKEKGVRNLKRCLETIVAKINVLQYLIAAQNKVEEPLYNEQSTKEKIDKKNSKNPKIKIGISLNITGKEDSKNCEKKKKRTKNTPNMEKIKKKKRKKLCDKDSKRQKDRKRQNNKVPKVNANTYREYGKDVLDLRGKELKEFVDSQLDNHKTNQIKHKEKIKRFKLIKKYKNSHEKNEINLKDNKKEKTKLEDIKVSDIVKFNIKNFKFPIEITNDMIKTFIKKDDINPSIEHLYM